MSADNPHVMVQPVEYLGLAEGLTGPPSAEPVTIVTIRPDPGSYRPHNIAIAKAQAERLWQDLSTVLNRFAVLLVYVLLAATGCSTRVEVESSNGVPPLPSHPSRKSQPVKKPGLRSRSPSSRADHRSPWPHPSLQTYCRHPQSPSPRRPSP